MQALGIIMILMFLHVFFAPFKRLRRAINEENYQEGGKSLGQIRKLVGFNLLIGLIVIIVAVGLEHLPV